MAISINLKSDLNLYLSSASTIAVEIVDGTGTAVSGATVNAIFIDAFSEDVYSKNAVAYETYSAINAAAGHYDHALTELVTTPYTAGWYTRSVSSSSGILTELLGGTTGTSVLVHITADAGVTGSASATYCLRVVRPAVLERLSEAGQDVDNTDTITSADLNTVGGVLRLLATLGYSNQIIDDITKSQKIYATNGTAVVLEFDLQDAAGLATVREPFRKLRA